jgi:ADP-ribosyl-[dinitrogen reductase] hydrolase
MTVNKLAASMIVDATLGCIVGGAIGDAAGTAFENRAAGSIADKFDFDAWRLSDDTQLTLATCEALLASGAANPESIAANFLRWHQRRWLSGLGASTLKALRDLEAGNHWALSGRSGERAAGNGAAMRIAPLAFTDPSDDEGRRLIRDVSRITHHNDEASIGARAVVVAVQLALTDSLQLKAVANSLPDTLLRDRLNEYAALPAEMGIKEAASRFGASGYVVESVPLALFAAKRSETIGFVEMVRELLAAGGDTDTNASIAGQIAGARLRLSGLPSEFVERLPQRDMVLETARLFANRVVQTSEMDCR